MTSVKFMHGHPDFNLMCGGYNEQIIEIFKNEYPDSNFIYSEFRKINFKNSKKLKQFI